MSQNTPTRTTVAASATVVNLFAAVRSTGSTRGSDAVNRIVHNDSAAILYLGYGSAVTATDFTAKIPADGYWEAPTPVFDGLITGIWSSATGSARLTEVVLT